MIKRHIDLTIESRIENVPLISIAVRNICSVAPFSDESLHLIELCVTEAVVNSIIHSHRKDPTKTVEVGVTISAESLTIEVGDHGVAMPPEAFEEKKELKGKIPLGNIDAIPESGRGLTIIHGFMDQVVYKKSALRNLLTMTKYLTNHRESKK